MSGGDAPIVCTGLEKTYRDFWGRAAFPALRGVDLTVARGASHALLGPNGSGKTTLLRILLGLMPPTRGAARLFGRDPAEPAARRKVGFLPEQSSLQPFLTCTETVMIHAGLHGASRSEAKARAAVLLDRMALTDAARKKARELSLGMRRRLALAVALAGRPELLVLDEPTAGMDPIVRESVVALFVAHVKAGGTLLVTSHLLGDISGIAADATLLANGAVARTGSLDDLLVRKDRRAYVVQGGPQLDAAACDAAVRDAAERSGGRVVSAGPERATIEDLFLDTYRRGGDAGGAGGR
ncbi:MAG: Vitamin B12 import ATP-binding protein BtuD [Planctomycetes bacterium]|nr:Vitamin B12 import ATP-binding protein BtuD [Planctomycetota bacterium]